MDDRDPTRVNNWLSIDELESHFKAQWDQVKKDFNDQLVRKDTQVEQLENKIEV